ncbi:MAG: DUF2240 family protein [Candidatus Aenigmatarchaeota archaeon]
MKVERIVETICNKFKVPKEKVIEEIKQKIEEFSGIISEEGAAVLVAREYGIDVREIMEFQKVEDLVGNMRGVNVKLKIIKITNTKEFDRRDGSKGRIRIIFAGDKTGIARIVLWDEQTQIVEELGLKEGNSIKLLNVRTRENIFGEIDLLLSKTSVIELADDKDLPSLDELKLLFSKFGYEKSEICKLSIGNYEIEGIATNAYKARFFEVCPICKAKVRKVDDKYFCDVHHEIEPQKALVISFEIDDFTGTIRAVAFREEAEKIAKTSELLSLSEEERKRFLKEKLLGKVLRIRGRVKFNKILNRNEIIVKELEIVLN